MGNGKSSPLKIRLSRVPNDPLFLLRCCTWALSLAFLFPVYSMEAAHHLATPPSEPPPQSAMFTFQLIKTVSDETELGYDGDRSACFR